ncbi:MAG: hypothetical protein K0Q47_1819, partial [Sedimentibacter sp.]|nr:hypothetical protein [Sedimentibacter sp.]
MKVLTDANVGETVKVKNNDADESLKERLLA